VQDVQMTLWDDTTVSGQLTETELTCKLRCGVTMQVPVALVEEYTQPAPQPSDAMIGKVKEQLAQLNADDWKARDRAETHLVGMGPIVAGTLKQLRGSQTPEAQQRIDSILKQFEKQAETRPVAGGGSTPSPQDGAAQQQQQAPAAIQPVQPQIEIINGPGR
jgi:hypothetical protein